MRLKVDVIEAGFPAASPGDFEAVHRIAQETKGGSRSRRSRAAATATRSGPSRRIGVAERPHLHVFISTSDIHLKHKLRMTARRPSREAVHWVRYGRETLGRDAEIEFSAKDATRTEHDFLLEVYEAVVEAGATDRQHPRHRRLRDPDRVRGARRARLAADRRGRRHLASTATTTSASRRRTRWPRSRRARARSR